MMMASLNEYMHTRNIYKNPLNFVELCDQFPELRKYTTQKSHGKLTFNFKDREALRSLCTALLKKDFDLHVMIPENHLVPTLPLRLNYILWIEDLLRSSIADKSPDTVCGIDIGTGATCIYPLLIAKKNGWNMTGIDISEEIIDSARQNVKINNLDHLISIVKISTSMSELFLGDNDFDFCMCNPPFFDSVQQHKVELPRKRNRAARQEAKMLTSGTPNEISSPGGEVTFIRNLIEESTKLFSRVRIYTTMIGCKSSVQPVLDILKEKEVHSYCETQFCQGRTMRWAVAWTFTDTSLESSTFSIPKLKPVKPLTWAPESKYNFNECVCKMNRLLEELQVCFRETKRSKNTVIWKIEACRNTWTGLRKKRREQLRKQRIDKCDQNEVESGRKEGSCSISTSDELENVSLDESDVEDCIPCKKPLLNEESASFVLEAEIELKQLHQNKDSNISIRVSFISGQKEAPQQILQYLKNNLV